MNEPTVDESKFECSSCHKPLRANQACLCPKSGITMSDGYYEAKPNITVHIVHKFVIPVEFEHRYDYSEETTTDQDMQFAEHGVPYNQTVVTKLRCECGEETER